MPLMRFKVDYLGHNAGDVVEASQTYAAALLEQNVAVDASEPVVERAVAPQPEKRTATKKV